MRQPSASTVFLLAALLFGAAACDTIYPPTPKADNTIAVVQTPKGAAAVPPGCASWSSATINPYDEQPLPQFGCATARNLAMMVERPEDLVKGRDPGNANPVTTVGAQRRYTANQTRGLLDVSSSPDSAPAATTSSAAASAITGEMSSGGGAASAAPAAPLGGGAPAAGP